MRTLTFTILLGLAAITRSNAADYDQAAAFEDAKKYRDQVPGLTSGINDGALANIPGQDPQRTDQLKNLYGNELMGPGTNRALECEQYTPGTNAYANQECDAMNFVRKNPSQRPAYTIDPNTDPLIQGGNSAITNSNSLKNEMTGLGGTYTACEDKTTTTPTQYSLERCQVGKAIAPYLCKKTLTVKCEPKVDGCDAGGIKPDSWEGDMAVAWLASTDGSYNLNFGTFANDYWKGNPATFDRTMIFTIVDLEKISTISLSHAQFDDWLMVTINDKLVYVGPHGGDRLQVVGPGDLCGDQECFSYMVQYGPSQFKYPELNTNWVIPLAIDIKPFLKNGVNVVKTRTIVAGKGESAITINARQYCPRVCNDVWDNQCVTYEQAQ